MRSDTNNIGDTAESMFVTRFSFSIRFVSETGRNVNIVFDVQRFVRSAQTIVPEVDGLTESWSEEDC